VPWGCDPGAINAPVLLLHGTEDRIIPASHGSWLAAHCPTAELRLCPGDSHFTIVTRAELGLEWLRRQV
jgi:pimeloyl-ACP methyl ester carboxylesterase